MTEFVTCHCVMCKGLIDVHPLVAELHLDLEMVEGTLRGLAARKAGRMTNLNDLTRKYERKYEYREEDR